MEKIISRYVQEYILEKDDSNMLILDFAQGESIGNQNQNQNQNKILIYRLHITIMSRRKFRLVKTYIVHLFHISEI